MFSRDLAKNLQVESSSSIERNALLTTSLNSSIIDMLGWLGLESRDFCIATAHMNCRYPYSVLLRLAFSIYAY